MQIDRKSQFIVYINDLPIKPKSKANYRAWVTRLERYLSADLSLQALRSNGAIGKLAMEVVVGYRRDHAKGKWTDQKLQSDAKCILGHYAKFLHYPVGPRLLEEKQNEMNREGLFNVRSADDSWEKVLRSIALRRGQPKFRRRLLKVYGHRCAVTGSGIEAVLEAAHIVPYNGESTNHVCNGLLLRSDVHALFDLGLLSIDPETKRIYCSEEIRREPIYGGLHGKELRVPVTSSERPDKDALRMHYDSRVR